MSAADRGRDGPPGRPDTTATQAALLPLEPAQRRQLLWISLGAVAVFVGLRLLPTGTNLSHMDFRVDPRAGNAIEFCDPLNPQFIPVIAARSPVVMTVTTPTTPIAGAAIVATITLKTAGGKAITPEDLLVSHTRRLHLLIVDPTLGDYQHEHPEPSGVPGEWTVRFTPRAGGVYRIFGDFTPAATGRGLYASVDLPVSEPATPPFVIRTPVARTVVDREGFRFSLTPTQSPVRTGQPIDLRFNVTRNGGGTVNLQPVMGAFAHLVAFDLARSGFAHLHPTETDLLKPLPPTDPTLNFKLTIPRSGRYVIWAQVDLEGRATFVPFALEVVD